MYKFEVGSSYEPNDTGYDPVKVIKRTAKMIRVETANGVQFGMKIRHDADGSEYAIDGSVPRKWKRMFTYQARYKI